MSLLSIVVISRNEGGWLRRTVRSLTATLPESSEIVVVDDASEDGSADFLQKKRTGPKLLRTPGVGVARARNFGARHTTGDVLIFVDAHMKLPPGWWQPLVTVLQRPRAGAAAPAVADTIAPDDFGYGFTLPQPDLVPQWYEKRGVRPFHAPILPGCCLAMPRDVFVAAGGFDEGLRARGGVDAETGVRLWLLGYQCWVVPVSKVWHVFRDAAPYPVSQKDVIHNRLRLAFCHLNEERVAQVLSALRGHPDLPGALRLVKSPRTAERRRRLLVTRKHDDNWYFQKFGITWDAPQVPEETMATTRASKKSVRSDVRTIFTPEDMKAIQEAVTGLLGAAKEEKVIQLVRHGE